MAYIENNLKYDLSVSKKYYIWWKYSQYIIYHHISHFSYEGLTRISSPMMVTLFPFLKVPLIFWNFQLFYFLCQSDTRFFQLRVLCLPIFIVDIFEFFIKFLYIVRNRLDRVSNSVACVGWELRWWIRGFRGCLWF